MLAPPAPLLLVLDGNSLLHRAYHAASSEPLWDSSGAPVWALKGLVGYVARAAAHLRPEAVIVGFDCPEHSARKADYPEYKAHRAEKPADLVRQIADAPELLRLAGICTVVPPAYEADDVLASCAAHARRSGWRSVLMTSDRDAFALIDASTSVLRVRNGGFDEAVLVDSAGLADLCGVEPWQYRDFAALRGDPSDNLRGVHRFGSTTAARLLAAFGSVEAAFAAIDAGQHEAVREAVGERAARQLCTPATRENVDRNRRIMRMRTDLPLPELDTARLPLSLAHMKSVLSARGINFGPSLWAITGGMPPSNGDHRGHDTRPWILRPRRRGRYDPIPGQLALF